MSYSRLVRNFFIGGDRFIPSRSLYKTSILRGYFAMGLFICGLFYFIVDITHGVYPNLPLYSFMLLMSIVALLLNRHGKYLLANIILLVFSNGVTYLFAASYRSENGINLFFITSGLFALGMFEYPQKKWWLSFIALPFILFLLSTLSDFSPLDQIGFTQRLTGTNYEINFCTAFCVAMFVMSFVLNLNHHSENSLRKNETILIHATEELEKSRLRSELAIKGSRAGIWEWSIVENVVYSSPVWKTMMGFDLDEEMPVKVEKFLERVHKDDKEKVDYALHDHLTNNLPYRAEFRMHKKDGSIVWVEDSGTALKDENGFAFQMVGSIIDITERKEAEQKIILQNELLAKTNDELDRFVYSTSHDLKSPLSSLLGLIIIAERTDDPEEAKACLVMMRERIRSMESFIKEITDYSRNTRLSVKSESINIFPVIHEIVENLRFSEGAENIFVRYDIPPDMSLLTDENRFKVVINNLIGNSIKYHDTTKDNPYISIEAFSKDNMIHISVEDNGIGIEPEHQGKIFDMFYRASEKSQGSGLGLYIVKETIQKLSGKVKVNSVPGKGTSFVMQFPVEMEN